MLFRTSPEVKTHKGPRPDIEEASARTGKVFDPKTDQYVKPKLVSDEVLAKAYDEVFYQKPVSGDYKYDADVLAESIAEQLGKVYDDLPQAQQFEIHNIALKRVTDDMKMKRTLKDVEQKMKLSDFDVTGKKGHAAGGIAGQLHLNRPGYREGLGVEKKKREYHIPPWHMLPNWREPTNFPYKSLEDIPPEVLDMLKKDPVFDLDTFLKKVAWSDSDKTRIQEKIKGKDEAWGLTSGMTGDMLLNYQKFGKHEPIAGGLINLKHIKDKDKVATILHEMRHSKMNEPWFAKSSAIPKWVQKYEEEGRPHYLNKDVKDKYKKYRGTQKDVSGEELYIRYLDQVYGDIAETGDLAGSEYKPYFDKILRDMWAPHAKAYREILEAEKSEMAKPVFRNEFRNREDYPLKSGGLAGQLHLNQGGRARYATAGAVGEGKYNPVGKGEWYPKMPVIIPKHYKKKRKRFPKTQEV
jgi:hypothetical protein